MLNKVAELQGQLELLEKVHEDLETVSDADLEQAVKVLRTLLIKIDSTTRVVNEQARLWETAIQSLEATQQPAERTLFDQFYTDKDEIELRNPVSLTGWKTESLAILEQYSKEYTLEQQKRERRSEIQRVSVERETKANEESDYRRKHAEKQDAVELEEAQSRSRHAEAQLAVELEEAQSRSRHAEARFAIELEEAENQRRREEEQHQLEMDTRRRIAEVRVQRAGTEEVRETTSPATAQSPVPEHMKLPKLPPVTMPSFNGRGDWTSFWEQFEDLVDKRADLADVTKLQYLESCMQGEAKKVFSTLVKRNVNYSLAKEHLTREYGDSERAQKRLTKELRLLKGKSDSLPDQLQLAREAESLIAQLAEIDGVAYAPTATRRGTLSRNASISLEAKLPSPFRA